MTRTLKPEDRIAHYRVVGPLGAGGMGEVYRARDQSLPRDVALKVLPPLLVQSEERVRRFELEAKSASSLNHPHIVTIYEIGQERVHSGNSPPEPDSSPLHYIAMELVSGNTLSAKIHQEKTDLKPLLGWLAQAAEGLAKAHAAGIVHRDLKPSNIMVSSDGYAKVLDFGLAKLTECQATDPDLTTAPTLTAEQTSEGVVLGTIGYMAPEQVLGKPVDPRADVFSFGAILYEAATRRQPFAADSQVETMHRILHDVPAPIETLNPEAPVELRRLIRRSLAKDPNQRPQSMRDLALELHEIADEYDALVATAGSGGRIATTTTPTRRAGRGPIMAWAMVAIVAVAAVVWILWRSRRDPAPFQTMRMTIVPTRDDVTEAAISPDGRFLAYAGGAPGRYGIWMRQLATDGDSPILSSQEELPTGLRFSPQGDYLFYLALGREQPDVNGLFEIASIGGIPRVRALDLGSAVTFAPDGRSVCFIRERPVERATDLVVRDLETEQERVLATNRLTKAFGAPVWSPDGARIAVIEYTAGSARPLIDTQGRVVRGPWTSKTPRLGPKWRLRTIRVRDGRPDEVGPDSTLDGREALWLPGGGGFVVQSQEETGTQLWLLPYPRGRKHRITNDLSSYFSPSLSSDGTTLAALRDASIYNVWMAETTLGGAVRQLTSSATPEASIVNAIAASDGSIYAVSDGRRLVRRIGTDGSGERVILSGATFGANVLSLPDGTVVFSKFGADGIGRLWRADANGGNARQLVSSPGGEFAVAASPDGRRVLYKERRTFSELWTIGSDGSDPHKVADSSPRAAIKISFSRDGARILYTSLEERDGHPRRIWNIVPERGDPKTILRMPPNAFDGEWSPDGKSITFLDSLGGTWNVYRQSLERGEPVRVTRFAQGQITDHEWSPDGKQIAVIRRTDHDDIWLTAPDGSRSLQLTHFDTGDIRAMDWIRPPGRGVFFLYGHEANEVVLIRNFR